MNIINQAPATSQLLFKVSHSGPQPLEVPRGPGQQTYSHSKVAELQYRWMWLLRKRGGHGRLPRNPALQSLFALISQPEINC